jgi:hypothetical protein
VLINTAGSGKTRLLLEGLCRYWGFYFVAKLDASGIGSSDVWRIMKELHNAQDYHKALEIKEKNSDPKAIQAAVNHIREVAERRFTQLLLARFLLLALLVEEARKLPGGLQQKEHRRLWVLLQIQPIALFERQLFEIDIFTDLTTILQSADLSDCKGRIVKLNLSLYPILEEVRNPATGQNTVLPFFCIFDEVQLTVLERFGEFVSEDNKTPRPILREIWLTLNEVLQPEQMRIVLSGTGIKLQALRDMLLSDACKLHKYKVKWDVGAFEDPEIQAEYIKHYIPACWSDPTWSEFLDRAWGWCRGR